MDFFDLKKQYQELKEEIDGAILNTLGRGVFIGGEPVAEFEKATAEFVGTKHAITLNSGTDALYLSMKALNIGTGDEVITTPFTFFATAETIAAVGARPVFVDIDPKTFNIDPAKLEAKLNELDSLGKLSKLKAIMPVHLFGQMADMKAIKEISQQHNLKIIEDCAQAIGAMQTTNGSEMKEGLPAEALAKAGTIGDIGCFSFFPTKNLGAYGDGGMVTTNNDELAAKIRVLKVHGSAPENKYKNLEIGVNSRLDAIQAAILNVKVKYLDQWNKKRAQIANYYNEQLAEVDSIITPFVAPGNSHIYHQYTIKTADRDNLAQRLKQVGIPTMVYYSIPLHLQPAFNYLGGKAGDLPESERAAAQVLSLPIYPELEEKDQGAVIKAIKDGYGIKNR